MSKRTYKALVASIVHWEDNCQQDFISGVDIRGSACALCLLYYSRSLYCSPTCPVKRATKKNLCEKSPWEYVRRMRERCIKYNEDIPYTRVDVKDFYRVDNGLRNAMKKELAFLKSLLPEHPS